MSEPFIGEIRIVGWNFAARGWAFCDGQLLPIAQNTALFSLLGTTYGGDGRTTFALPDLRGRIPLHPGNGPGLPQVRLGERGGATAVTLTESNLPAHNHGIQGNSGDGETDEPVGNFPAKAGGGETIYSSAQNATMNVGMVANTGDGQSFSVRNPFLGLHFMIALQGIFPSRN